MDRREFLKSATLIGAGMLAPGLATTTRADGDWRQFELVTKVTLDPERGASRVWVPVPTHVQLDHQKPIANTCQGNYTKAGIFREPVYGCEGVYAEWNGADVKGPMKLEVSSRVSVRDRAADLSQVDRQGNKVPEDVALYLKGTPSAPTDGIVLATATKIAGDRRSAIDKAHAVYDWIIENGVRDPNVTGCGTGDVVAMLETGNISGKCADLNGLFVALVRSLGVPTRDVYGIRVADSRYYKSLGKYGDITKAQHCRAEFYVDGIGWVPVDGADVLKASLEEKLPIESKQIEAERLRQFGTWEGNWITYNTARDVTMNPPTKGAVEFFMYPRAETQQGVLNHLDPKPFHYEITSAQLSA